MIKVTQDLKYTLTKYKNIETVYFDKFGNHYFTAHKHGETMHEDKQLPKIQGNGKLYHKITDLAVTNIKDVNGRSVSKRERVYEAHDDHELVDQLSAKDVLAMPLADKPKFQDKEAAEIFEKQSQENAKLRAELEDLKNQNEDAKAQELEALKAELEKARQDKEAAEQLLSEASQGISAADQSSDKKKK